MEDQKIDYKAVLADLKAKRDKIDSAIAGIEAMTGLNLSNSNAGKNGDTAPQRMVSPMEIAEAAIPGYCFSRMTTIDAAKKFLEMKQSPQTARQIADALIKGGMISQAKSFTNNINAILKRAEHKSGMFIRDKNAWGLGEWYEEKSE